MFSRFSHKSDLSRLDGLIRQLPFDLDDGAAVGALYAEWKAAPGKRNQYLIDLWTYCYVRRYFLVKFVRSEGGYSSGDLEMVIERAFKKISIGRETVREATRYPNWVVVVCRNTFVNFVTRQPDHVPVDRIAEPRVDPEPLDALHDQAIRASALDAAIRRLPAWLRVVARLRLVDGLAYEVIQERTGIPVPSVRTYANKAVMRLRQDKALLRGMGYEAENNVSGGS